MDNIFNKLTEIEIAASRILDSASNEKKMLDEQQEERFAEFDREMDEKTAAEVTRLRQELSSSMESELQKLKSSSEKAMDALEQYYQNNHEILAQKIYETIIRK